MCLAGLATVFLPEEVRVGSGPSAVHRIRPFEFVLSPIRMSLVGSRPRTGASHDARTRQNRRWLETDPARAHTAPALEAQGTYYWVCRWGMVAAVVVSEDRPAAVTEVVTAVVTEEDKSIDKKRHKSHKVMIL